MHMIKRCINDEAGYSLVVVAALFAAMAAVAVAYLDRDVVTQQLALQGQVRDQMARLTSALDQYEYATGNLPCPASVQTTPIDNNFGAGVSNCYSTNQAGVAQLSGSTQVIQGMVPVRDLAAYGVDVQDATDPWGGRIMYVVNRFRTPGNNGGATVNPALSDIALGGAMPAPSFVLISYGRDRRGAYLRGQSAAQLAAGPSIGCSGSENRSENCNGDLNFKIGPANTGSTVTTGTYFDDIVTYTTRSGACFGRDLTWGSAPCSATAANLGDGASAVLVNIVPDYTGKATVTCTTGTLAIASSTCNHVPVNGGWTSWSSCSAVACGTTGSQYRTCTNPAPAYGGVSCVGASSRSCNSAC